MIQDSVALLTLPFGRNLRLTPRQMCRVYFECRQAWQRCKQEAAMGVTDNLLLPRAEDPFHFKWPVRDRDCYVIDWIGEDLARVKRTAAALLNAGARLIFVSRPFPPCYFFGDTA